MPYAHIDRNTDDRLPSCASLLDHLTHRERGRTPFAVEQQIAARRLAHVATPRDQGPGAPDEDVRRQEAHVAEDGRSIVDWVFAAPGEPQVAQAVAEKIPIEYTLIARPRCLFGNEPQSSKRPRAAASPLRLRHTFARMNSAQLLCPAARRGQTDQTSSPEMSRRRFRSVGDTPSATEGRV